MKKMIIFKKARKIHQNKEDRNENYDPYQILDHKKKLLSIKNFINTYEEI